MTNFGFPLFLFVQDGNTVTIFGPGEEEEDVEHSLNEIKKGGFPYLASLFLFFLH